MGNVILKTTPAFEKKAKQLPTEEMLDKLYEHLEIHPEKGALISGTGGIRKLRWKTGKNNKGKSGGVRILYHYSQNILVLLITIYGKSEQDNISQKERNLLKEIIPEFIAKYTVDL